MFLCITVIIRFNKLKRSTAESPRGRISITPVISSHPDNRKGRTVREACHRRNIFQLKPSVKRQESSRTSKLKHLLYSVRFLRNLASFPHAPLRHRYPTASTLTPVISLDIRKSRSDAIRSFLFLAAAGRPHFHPPFVYYEISGSRFFPPDRKKKRFYASLCNGDKRKLNDIFFHACASISESGSDRTRRI